MGLGSGVPIASVSRARAAVDEEHQADLAPAAEGEAVLTVYLYNYDKYINECAYIYIYIYRERERCIYTHIHIMYTYIYIYMYT